MPKQVELENEDDIKIRTQTQEERDKNTQKVDTPIYRLKIDLDDDQKKRLTEDFFEEFEALKTERKDSDLKVKWDKLDVQYDGNISENTRLKFNLHVPQSRIKVDAITRALKEAFLDSDPKFAVTPRPDFTGKGGLKVAEDQSDFLDFAMDEEIKPEKELSRIFKQGVKKYVGIQKISWGYCRERRKREESYEGKFEPESVGQGGELKVKNEGLESFLKTYPTALKEYPGLVRKLLEEKTINVVVEYLDTIDNNPELTSIRVEDFYVRNSADSNKKLRNTHCIAERQRYTWWELLKKEQGEEWENIEELKNSGEIGEDDDHNKESTTLADFKTRDYNVLEATYYFKLKESDEEEVKIKAWFGEERKVLLGVILYPYYGFDVDYKGYWPSDNGKGFYGNAESVMWVLKDSNIAQNALLNLALHGTYARNIMTPITREGSEIEQLILENRWQEGMPLSVPEGTDDVRKDISFLEYPQLNLQDIMALKAKLEQQDSDVSLVSEGQSGRESSLDPKAPGNKTIALLRLSGINIQDYIRALGPSFNETGGEILQLYYQMSNQSRKFRTRVKSVKVTGDNPFSDITRDVMVAKTNIQTRAMSFAFDKISEKQENLAFNQLLLSHPIALQRPKLLYRGLLAVMKSWSPMWKNLADTELPNPEEFALEQRQVAVQAIGDFIQLVKKQSEVTGVEPDIDLGMLTNAIGQAQQVSLLGQEEEK